MLFKKKAPKAEEQIQKNSSITEELKKVMETPVKEEYRYVFLRASSCCGCGCTDIKIKRKVPIDSPLKDNDYVGSDIEKTDIIV